MLLHFTIQTALFAIRYYKELYHFLALFSALPLFFRHIEQLPPNR